MKYPISFEIEFRKHQYPGIFIALEGIDGSGKTTHAKELVQLLEKEGIKAVYTKEPTDGVVGELIRKVLNSEIKIPPISLQYLFCADRGIHQEEIEDYLKKGYVVVSDRYFWSAVAYGIADLAGSEDFYVTVFSILSFYNRFLSPDCTFFLDVDVEEADRRLTESHKQKEIYENRGKLIVVDEAYKKLIEKFNEEFTIVDANKPIDAVSKDLFNQVKKKLKYLKKRPLLFSIIRRLYRKIINHK